jgi:tRNA1Val (adenine37-N6)-methyltransferase
MTFEISQKPFTYQYSQPSEYRFSMDSVEMAFRLGMESRERQLARPLRVLDLCAGCGVLGFEFHFFERRIEFVDFVEVQEEYLPHFAHNRSLVNADPERFRFRLQNYVV